MIHTGNRIKTNETPLYEVIYLRHRGNNIQVRWQFHIQYLQQEENDQGAQDQQVETLNYKYINIPRLDAEILLQHGVPQYVIDEIFTQNNQLWHEADKTTRVYLTLASIEAMLEAFPEMARYVVQNNITFYVQGAGVYLYVNYLLPPHMQLLTSFGAIITDKKKE